MLRTKPTSPGAADDTRDALMLVSGHDSLLSDEWRAWLYEALHSLDHVDDDETGVLAVRSARAAAVIAAVECAQAARFEARLIGLTASELDRMRSELEMRRAAMENAQALNAAHLDSAIDDLMAEFRAYALLNPRGGSAARYRHLFGGDIARVLRDYGERTEELLLELGEAASAHVGIAMGGLLPLRASHVVPLVDVSDELNAEQLAAVIDRVITPYRDGLSTQLASVMSGLRTATERARQWQRLGGEAARERVDALMEEAQELDHLALSLDWLPVAPS